jgi:type IV pilus assembly protein PilV
MRPARRTHFAVWLARGYTAVEVLLAMTVFAIGATAVISMQRTTIQGDIDSRRLDVANGIARAWVERLRRDAMGWTIPPCLNLPPAPCTPNLPSTTTTQWLGTFAASGKTGAFQDPTSACPGAGNVEGLCNRFDILGRDIAGSDNTSVLAYCTQIRLDWLDTGVPAGNSYNALKAEVRVFWPRNLLNSPSTWACPPTPAPDTSPQYYHFVYASTALRPTPR